MINIIFMTIGHMLTICIPNLLKSKLKKALYSNISSVQIPTVYTYHLTSFFLDFTEDLNHGHTFGVFGVQHSNAIFKFLMHNGLVCYLNPLCSLKYKDRVRLEKPHLIYLITMIFYSGVYSIKHYMFWFHSMYCCLFGTLFTHTGSLKW